jgi:protein SCO1/2
MMRTNFPKVRARSLWQPFAHIVLLALLSATAWGSDQTYAVEGMVLKVDVAHKTVIVSCQAISGYMEAMAMPFEVRDAKELDDLAPGASIGFKLVVQKDSSYIEGIKVHTYQGLEVDPLTARRLKLLNQVADPTSTAARKPLAIGQSVPNFKLLDQNRRHVELSKFSGKIVALDFVYTRCALPDFCFRTSNNFARLQKRFKENLGRDLVLLTVTFDPAHDQPDVLLKYSATWKASPSWHFLTGTPADVQKVCALFGLDAFQDEGLLNHSLHTAVIDRKGKLVANLEGNQFTAEQLGDLVQTVIDPRP